jgi:hypothetical protein
LLCTIVFVITRPHPLTLRKHLNEIFVKFGLIQLKFVYLECWWFELHFNEVGLAENPTHNMDHFLIAICCCFPCNIDIQTDDTFQIACFEFKYIYASIWYRSEFGVFFFKKICKIFLLCKDIFIFFLFKKIKNCLGENKQDLLCVTHCIILLLPFGRNSFILRLFQHVMSFTYEHVLSN